MVSLGLHVQTRPLSAISFHHGCTPARTPPPWRRPRTCFKLALSARHQTRHTPTMATEASASVAPSLSEQNGFKAGPHNDRLSQIPASTGSGRTVLLIQPFGHHDILAHDLPSLDTDGAALVADAGEPGHDTSPIEISKSLTVRLYLSHFLSTWNSRLFEAAVVYFLASIFPDNLLPISAYAIGRNVAAIALTVPVGVWIDRGNRLTVVRSSILGQRISVAASCGLFWVMLERPLSLKALNALFAATVLLACVEKLSAGVNLVSVERDWVVVITEGNEAARRTMNARMRRIDLFCKLLGPLFIALIAAVSISAAIYSTMGMNLGSVPVEYLCIETVHDPEVSFADDILKSFRYFAGSQPSGAPQQRPADRQRSMLTKSRGADSHHSQISNSGLRA